MAEEAIIISESNQQEILDKYDVYPQVLARKVGYVFVGEVGCDWWFAILGPNFFDAKYTVAEKDKDVSPFLFSTIYKKELPLHVG